MAKNSLEGVNGLVVEWSSNEHAKIKGSGDGSTSVEWPFAWSG